MRNAAKNRPGAGRRKARSMCAFAVASQLLANGAMAGELRMLQKRRSDKPSHRT